MERDIAGRKNVERLFNEFDFPAPPSHPPRERPNINVKPFIATPDPPRGAGPLPKDPGGAGPLPGTGDDDHDELDEPPLQRRSGQIAIRDLPRSNSRGPMAIGDIEDPGGDQATEGRR